MRRRIELLDTSILVTLLRVPGESDNVDDVEADFEARRRAGVQFHLPVGALVEAAKHVEWIHDGNARRSCAERFHLMIERTLNRETPWTLNEVEWEALLAGVVAHDAAADFVESMATKYLEAGDLLILSELVQLRRNLERGHVHVDVWTLDGALRATVDALQF
jgi:hypothetical protein